MGATVEFRKVKMMVNDSNANGQWYEADWKFQYRTKDVIVGLLGVSVSSWSPWQDLPEIMVDNSTEDPL